MKLRNVVATLVLLAATLGGAAPLGYAVSGCASGCTNGELTATATPFTVRLGSSAPLWISVSNDDAADALFVDVTGATAVNNATTTTSITVKAGEKASWGFPYDNGPGTISMICAATKTCAYRLGAGR